LKEAAENGRAFTKVGECERMAAFLGSVTLTALHNEFKELTGFMKITKDLTDQKNADDKLKR
jgi:hypothetical protein